MERQAIIERVKIKLDEFTPVDSGVDHPLDKYINPLLVEAATTLQKEAPLKLLKHDQYIVGADDYYFDAATGLNKVWLDETVLRVASIKLPNWSMVVTNFHAIDSLEAEHQKDKYTRAGTIHPVVIESQELHGSSAAMCLNCYTHPEITDPATILVSCIKDKLPEELHQDLIIPLVFLCAYMVAKTTERNEVAAALYPEYQKAIAV